MAVRPTRCDPSCSPCSADDPSGWAAVAPRWSLSLVHDRDVSCISSQGSRKVLADKDKGTGHLGGIKVRIYGSRAPPAKVGFGHAVVRRVPTLNRVRSALAPMLQGCKGMRKWSCYFEIARYTGSRAEQTRPTRLNIEILSCEPGCKEWVHVSKSTPDMSALSIGERTTCSSAPGWDSHDFRRYRVSLLDKSTCMGYLWKSIPTS